MNRSILVTGASRGIGRAIAGALARDGFTVVVHYAHREDLAIACRDEILAAGGHARTLGFDVADRAACSASVNAPAPCTSRIPRPPPPAEALTISGNPIRSASAISRASP